MKTSQVDQCVAGTGDIVARKSDIVAGTGDIVAGTGTGAIQEGKRARKPSQRARALQEDTQAKVRAVSILWPYVTHTSTTSSGSLTHALYGCLHIV